jgi:hypothetical protein
VEDLPDDRGPVVGHLEAGDTVARAPVDVSVAVGRPRQNADGAGLRQVALAATAALQQARSFVLREHALHLKQQIVFRRLPERPVEEDDPRAGARELFDENGLVRVAARETVGRVHVDDVDGTQGRHVAQPFQGRTDQAGPTDAIVEEAQPFGDVMAVGGGPRQEVVDLAVDGMLLSLAIGGHAGVEGCPGRIDRAQAGRSVRGVLHQVPPH